VAADLNNRLLGDVLASRGLHGDQRTLFLMEGVIYFLTAKAVDSLLRSIRDCSAIGSALAFDYVVESMANGTCDRYGAQQMVSRLASTGEAFQFGIDDHEIESFLGGRGYRLIRQLTPEDLEARYLVTDGHPALGSIAGFYSIAQAVTC
jgi:methyltransferase (TIGR00027 family)